MNDFWNDVSRTPHDGCLNEQIMKVTGRIVNIEINQLFFKMVSA